MSFVRKCPLLRLIQPISTHSAERKQLEDMRDDKKLESQRAKSRALFYSTTEGRQKLPDILQVSYGEKAVIGFDRYGRALGALVPMEAVEMLAGSTRVDADVRDRIQRTAKSLLDQ